MIDTIRVEASELAVTSKELGVFLKQNAVFDISWAVDLGKPERYSLQGLTNESVVKEKMKCSIEMECVIVP